MGFLSGLLQHDLHVHNRLRIKDGPAFADEVVLGVVGVCN